ncbi:MAG TPA: DUF4390 domain-containing protein [Thermodesulfobacteriota bacterium]|nr:DUF4390 domain-containing protein [Thermodesulfobacteriota bacterium]
MKNLIILLITVLSFLLPSAARSEDARIADVVVSRSPALAITFSVQGAFTSEMDEAIHSGIPTTFNFIVEVNRVRGAWFDEPLSVTKFSHSVKYDSLKEEYEISIDEMGEKSIRTKDPKEMKALMSVVTSVDIKTPEPIVKGEQYEFRVKAELRTVDLPFLLNYLLFFVKLWDFETGWYTYTYTP